MKLNIILVALGLVTIPCHAALIAKYYTAFDYEKEVCVGDYLYQQVAVPGGTEKDWEWGPRGKRDRFCVEYHGNINIKHKYFAADADDGVKVWIGGVLVVDKWNSHDPRGCPLLDGCQPKQGNQALKIIYYQDYGQAHLRLKGGSAVDESKMELYDATAFAISAAEITALGLNKQFELQTLTTDCCTPHLNPGCNNPCMIYPIDLGRIGSVTEMWASTYWNGRASPLSAFYFIKKCTDLLYLGTNNWTNSAELNNDKVVLEVRMGSIVDYFKPLPGKNLCNMLMSNRFHLWSGTGKPGTFIQPKYYYHESLVGGSDNNWPRDNIIGDERVYLSFFGGNNKNGACCHNTKNDEAKWNKEARLRVFAAIPEKAPLVLSNDLVSYKTPVNTWTRYAVIKGTWNTEKMDSWAASGFRDEYAGVNSGAFFMRSCATWNASKDAIVLAICMHTDIHSAVECKADGVIDYFKPTPGSNLCDMLANNDKHIWAYNTAGANWGWQQPQYYPKHLGGSLQEWPARWCQRMCPQLYNTNATCTQDNECTWRNNRCEQTTVKNDTRCSDRRVHLPFWGGHNGGYGILNYAGAKNDWNSPGKEAWYRSFSLRIAKFD